jgi:predicted anti-sigma-YlaC factor YlaD
MVFLYNKVVILSGTMKERPCVKFVADMKNCLATLILILSAQDSLPFVWYQCSNFSTTRLLHEEINYNIFVSSNKQIHLLTNFMELSPS